MTGQPAAPASLAAALAALQAQMPAVGKHNTADVKNKEGRKLYDYSYAAGEDITAKLYPVMAPLGLSYLAKPGMTEMGFVLQYSLLHVSGEREDGWYPLPDPARLGPQDLGKAITYARRYALCALIGLFPGGDDTDATSDGKAIDATSGLAPGGGMTERQLAGTRKPRTGTNAELRSQGRMDRVQKAAHDKLEADTKRPARGERAQRSRPSAPDPDDPWAADQPVTRDRAAGMRDHLASGAQPEDRPGSMLPGQHRAIEAMLGMLGFKPGERAQRHGHAALRLDLDELPPRPGVPGGGPSLLGLSVHQAARLIQGLQDDLDDLKKDDLRRAEAGA